MTIARNVLAVLLGLVLCMVVNGGLIAVGAALVPAPEGVNPNDLESVRENIHRYQPQHFAVPLLAHALGSFVGALAAAGIAASRKLIFAMVIGAVHLLGGITACFMIPAPIWFIAADLIVAYLPMAWLGGKLLDRRAASP